MYETSEITPSPSSAGNQSYPVDAAQEGESSLLAFYLIKWK